MYSAQGAKKERKGEEKRKKEEEEREKVYDQLVNISSSKKITNFYQEKRGRKGERNIQQGLQA